MSIVESVGTIGIVWVAMSVPVALMIGSLLRRTATCTVIDVESSSRRVAVDLHVVDLYPCRNTVLASGAPGQPPMAGSRMIASGGRRGCHPG